MVVKIANADKVIFPCRFEVNDPKFTGTVTFNEAQKIKQGLCHLNREPWCRKSYSFFRKYVVLLA